MPACASKQDVLELATFQKILDYKQHQKLCFIIRKPNILLRQPKVWILSFSDTFLLIINIWPFPLMFNVHNVSSVGN